jgi:hypothetical protein
VRQSAIALSFLANLLNLGLESLVASSAQQKVSQRYLYVLITTQSAYSAWIERKSTAGDGVQSLISSTPSARHHRGYDLCHHTLSSPQVPSTTLNATLPNNTAISFPLAATCCHFTDSALQRVRPSCRLRNCEAICAIPNPNRHITAASPKIWSSFGAKTRPSLAAKHRP